MGLFCILKKNEKRMKKMFDMPRPPMYKADLCSSKRLEKQALSAVETPKKTTKVEKLGVDGS